MRDDLQAFFLEPKTPRQRQYEALRAYVLEGINAKEVGLRFGFTETSIYALAHDLRIQKLDLFPKAIMGPKDRRVTPYVRHIIYELRKENFSTTDIIRRLRGQNVTISESTVERILKEAGFGKLQRRTASQRGVSTKNTMLAQSAQNLDFDKLKPFRAECQVVGVFLFLPYLIESGIADVLKMLPLPESSRIGKIQAGLSFLLLKLIGGERLSHVRQYDHDLGFGLFAGLNVLPKPTYMSNYSCRMSAEMCLKLQREMVGCFMANEPGFYSGGTINLDFHSIPHFGEQSEMEKVWCGARNKAMKGANTFFAQDAKTKALLYANADVLKKEGSAEILHFVDYLKDIKGVIKETLVFDSRLTTYQVLNELDKAGIKFITLRRRCKSLKEQTDALPDEQWQKVKLPIPKRKYQKFLANESDIKLTGCERQFRQIIMKDHGRIEPTYVITNNRELELVDVLVVYARRWRIENKLAELVDFFNINALSSPIMVRIHFDLLLSVAASFLYQLFAKDLPRFENHLAPDIFRRFVDIPGTVCFDGKCFEIHLRKRAHTPILLGVEKLQQPLEIPWLEGRPLKIVWRA